MKKIWDEDCTEWTHRIWRFELFIRKRWKYVVYHSITLCPPVGGIGIEIDTDRYVFSICYLYPINWSK